MSRLLPLLVLGGCVRDPTFFGYWDIEAVERDGVLQEDVGFFEISGSADMSLFLRYQWDGAGFVPDPHPVVQVGPTDATPHEVFGNYKSKGEVWVVTFDLFGATFHVPRYVADEAELFAEEALWPGGEPGGDVPAPTRLFLRR
jgi:hypothetical protein